MNLPVGRPPKRRALASRELFALLAAQLQQSAISKSCKAAELVLVHGATASEAAELTGVSLSSVTNTMRRLRKRHRAAMRYAVMATREGFVP